MRFDLFLLFACIGCQTGQASSPAPGAIEAKGETVVTVNGHDITQGMVDATIQQLPEQVRQRMEQTGQIGQVQEQLVVAELLYRESLKQNLHETETVQTTIALAARSALAQALLEKVVDERTTDEAVKKWYDDHLVQFARPQVKASHILVKDEALAKEVAGKIAAGGDFSELAKAHSMDPGSKNEGGSLGWFSKNDMVEPFASTAFEIDAGKVSDVVQTRFGFHIIKVEDKRDQTPLEEVREQIEGQMGQTLVQEYIEEIKGSATITKADAAATEAPAEGGAKK